MPCEPVKVGFEDTTSELIELLCGVEFGVGKHFDTA
jgi:hypothetical protein